MRIMGLGFPETIIVLLAWLVPLAIGALVLYWIVRKAVAAGLRDYDKTKQLPPQ